MADATTTTVAFVVVGQRFRWPTIGHVAKAVDSIRAGAPVALVREPKNPYDSNAIMVLMKNPFDPASQGQSEFAGYVPRAIAEHIAPLLDQDCPHKAMFVADCNWLVEVTFEAAAEAASETTNS